MPSETTSIRLRPELRTRINRLATRSRRTFSETAQDLLDEALRMRTCPGIYFADEPGGRVAKVAGTGLGIWEIIRDYREQGESEPALRRMFPQLSTAQIRACLLYYSMYPAEIDAAIEENRGVTFEEAQRELGDLVQGG